MFPDLDSIQQTQGLNCFVASPNRCMVGCDQKGRRNLFQSCRNRYVLVIYASITAELSACSMFAARFKVFC